MQRESAIRLVVLLVSETWLSVFQDRSKTSLRGTESVECFLDIRGVACLTPFSGSSMLRKLSAPVLLGGAAAS
jgi:hypothetical protein